MYLFSFLSFFQFERYVINESVFTIDDNKRYKNTARHTDDKTTLPFLCCRNKAAENTFVVYCVVHTLRCIVP